MKSYLKSNRNHTAKHAFNKLFNPVFIHVNVNDKVCGVIALICFLSFSLAHPASVSRQFVLTPSLVQGSCIHGKVYQNIDIHNITSVNSNSYHQKKKKTNSFRVVF
jgi:hypothetical protein